MTHRVDLIQYLDTLLQPSVFKDYCPNGLQVEGSAHVRKLATGVTASLATIEAAVEQGADTLLVHHGLFWRGQDGSVTGWMRKRLALLLAHNINLLAYHLPLDAHAELGNNAQWGLRLGFSAAGRFGDQQLGWIGTGAFADALTLAKHVECIMGRAVLCVPGHARPIQSVAWCSGGAQGYFEAAIAAGADAYLTGEISEPQAHLARECGVAFLACGHHATERYGVAALGAHLASVCELEHVVIDIDNPA